MTTSPETVEETCAVCGEPMDFDDCLESEDGKHQSRQERDAMLEALRQGRQESYDELEKAFNRIAHD